MSIIKNVMGNNLKPCSMEPLTGYHRDGYCNCGHEDPGQHIICVITTKDFLEFSQSRGNDLSTPYPQFGFPGLKPGDRWCLCLMRWVEALAAGKAPLVDLEATHEDVLKVVDLEVLKQYAYAMPEPL